MSRFEYKVIPAPTRGIKAKGVKTAEARFSNAIEALMNQLATEGWEYQRAETLPSVERSGLTSTTTEWRNLLIFRRAVETGVEGFAPDLLPPPADAAAVPPVAEPERTEPSVEKAAPAEESAPRETAVTGSEDHPVSGPKEDEARKRADASDVSDSPIPKWLTDARKSRNPDT